MAKGLSPLRLLMRNPQRKTVPDNIDGNSSGQDGPAAAGQSRQPLGPITEIVRNPLIPVAEQSSGDPSTPRAKAKISSHGQEKFPHLENSESHATSVNVTPDKSANLHSKGKFTWQHRHGSSAHNVPREVPPDLTTPPRPPRGSAFSDSQAPALFGNNQDTLQSLSSNLRGCGIGGGSVSSTPKTGRSVGNKPTSDLENGGSQSQNATPCKTVSRSLKYGQQGSASNTGASGLTSVRSSASQHVITRPIGYLQAIKGVLPQTANQNFVEHHFELEEDASFWRDHNIQVIIRTRPISNSESASQGSNRCLKQESPHTVTWLGQPESRFTFDHVAGETITQAKLFDVAGLPMVENCISGYNSCMFAYGQTGSGKTHTMLGDIEHLDRSPSDNRGMTPRVFEYLFGRIRMEQDCRRQEHLKFFCKCSFLEIYNEQITDLLEPSSTNLQMREDAKKGVYVENLSEVEVQCVQDVIRLLLQGAANRKVAATNMNRESSRSHSVFTCVVESKWENNSMTNSRYGRLHLVDLAGSERQKSSGAEGGRLKEAANINKSLSTLGLVIMILVDVANGKQRHVPYRDSKLTFLLQDSLGGNSKTIMIANVSPSSCCAMETLSTLKFAQRAKFIRNNAVINEDASGDVIALRQRIEELKVEVDRLRRERILRISSSRVLALDSGSIGGRKGEDKLDASVDCTATEASALDSVIVNNSQTISSVNNEKYLRSIEAVLAGALRREQQAEDMTKKLAAEIEQLNRLVRQREEDSQCSKMMLRFREEKIRRLEGISDNVISAEAFYEDERKNLVDEVQLLRGRLDRNPELTRFAMENIRLMEELRRYQEFYDGSERDVLLEELSGLRGQLLDILDTKLGEEQAVSKLSTPQKRALAPELSTLERENELLLIEVKSYQDELKECRNNLNSCLVANADLARQVDKLQATVKQLQSESKEVPNIFSGTSANHALPQETAPSPDANIRLEARELALKERHALINVEEQVTELRKQLIEAQNLIQKLSSEVAEAKVIPEADDLSETDPSDRSKRDENVSSIAENETAVRQGIQDRWEKLQEIEMRHSEEMTQLQLQLDSLEDVLEEERQQRLLAEQRVENLNSKLSAAELIDRGQPLSEDALKEERQHRFVAEQKSEELSSQLSVAVSKLEEAQCLVEALEGQQLFSINEFENLQSEHSKLLSKLKEQDLEGVLQEQYRDENIVNDPAVSILEQKLQKAQRGKEEARRMNRQFQEEKALRMALEKEREVTMSEVETQAALAITTLQSEILELREEVSLAVEAEATAKLQTAHVQKQVEALQQTIGGLENNSRLLSEKLDEYRNLVDYLADGDKALTDAAKEMDDIKQGKVQEISRMVDHDLARNGDTAASMYHRLNGIQLMVRETEGKVRALSEAATVLGEETSVLKCEKVQGNHELYSNGPAKDEECAALQQQLEELRRQLAQFHFEHQLVVQRHEDLRQEYDKCFLELERAKDLKAESVQESCRALAEKDAEIANLQGQLSDSHNQSAVMADRFQLLMAAHASLQQEQERELEDKALKNEEAKKKIKLSEGKAMALLVMVQHLQSSRDELNAANLGLVKEIEDERLLLEQKQAALGALGQRVEQENHQYEEIAAQYQLLAETHANLNQEREALLAEKGVRVEEKAALLKSSERKATAAFVMVKELLEKIKEQKAINTSLANQIQEACLSLAEKDTAFLTLQTEMSEHLEIARKHQVLTEAHENLRKESERLMEENVFRAKNGERAVMLSEKKAMAALVMLRNVVDGKNELKTETERLEMEIQESKVALVEKDTEMVALEQKLEHSVYKSKEIADQYQVLKDDHLILRTEYDRLEEQLEKGQGAQERLQEELEKAQDVEGRLHGELVKAGEEHQRVHEELAKLQKDCEILQEQLKKSQAGQEKVQKEVETAREGQDGLQGQLVKAGEEHKALHDKLAKSEEELERLLEELEKAREEQEELTLELKKAHEEQEKSLRENALSIEHREQMIKLSEKKAMGSLVIVEHLTETLKVLRGAQSKLEKEIQESHLGHIEKDTSLTVLQSRLEESHSSHQDVLDEHRLVVGKYDILQREHETFAVENSDLKRRVEVLESDLNSYHGKLEFLQDMSVSSEQQCTAVLPKVLSIAAKAHSVYDVQMTESVEFMINVKERLDLLCQDLSLVEREVDHFDSVERDLSAFHAKVLMLEAESGGNRYAMATLQTEISQLGTTLQLKERDLQMALEKEAASNRKWEEEKASLLSEREQSRRDYLEKEEMVDSLLVQVQRLDSTVKETELRVSDMLTSIQALTIAKKDLEFENSRLALGAREVENKYRDKELQTARIQSDLAELQAKLSVAEVREQSVSGQMDYLAAVTVEWEIEKAVVEHETHKLRLQLGYLNFEMENREKVIMESFRTSQEALENVEARMAGINQELGGSEITKGNLEHNIELLESAALGDLYALEEKELECLDLKRQLGIANVEITQMQSALDLATTQFVLEKRDREADIRIMEEERRACEAKVRDEIAAAELMLLSTEGNLNDEVRRLDSNLKLTELRVSEMLRGVNALTVAKDELELEKGKLVQVVRLAEMNCSEKEQEFIAIQGDLAEVRGRLMEAELREKKIAEQMEELTEAKIQWEVERALIKREIEEMSKERDQVQFGLGVLNAEVEEREIAVLESFRKSQEALECVEARLTTMDQEFVGLDRATGNLAHSIGLLDSAVGSNLAAVQGTEQEYLQVQRRAENTERQMSEMQTASDLVIAQIVLERDRWEADKQERDAREAELRDEIVAAELKLVATEASLKGAVESVEALVMRKAELEEEILKLNEDAKISLLKVTEQQKLIDTLRGTSKALQAECSEADENIAALKQVREQYVLAEARWKSEQDRLTRNVEESEFSAVRRNLGGSKELSEESEDGGNVGQCLPECSPLPEDQNRWEESQQLERQRHDNQVLRAKISGKDRTILSAKKEMEKAIANLKEAELEMEKAQLQNHRLTIIQLENKSLIDSLSLKLKTAEEELLKRDQKIEGCEAELRKVASILSDWEMKMHDFESEWRREKEALAQELTEAKLVANEKRTEAAVLLQKFQDGQTTMKEAEDLVHALVRANENAKHDALDWKTEKESLSIVQGWWMPERDKLISEVARLEIHLHTQKQDFWIICKDAVNGLVVTMETLLVVDQELSQMKNEYQQEMEHLVAEMKQLKDDLVGLLQFPGDLRVDLDCLVHGYRQQTESWVGVERDDPHVTENYQSVQLLSKLEAQMKGRTKEIEVLQQRIIELETEKAKGFENMQTGVSELTSERDLALKDSAHLRGKVANQETNVRSLEEESSGYLMNDFDESFIKVMTALAVEENDDARIPGRSRNNTRTIQGEIIQQEIAAMSAAKLESVGKLLEFSENSGPKEEDFKLMHLELELARSELARVQKTARHLEAELQDRTNIVRDYDDLRRSAEANAQLLAKSRTENAMLVQCLKDVEQSYAACSSELLELTRTVCAESLIFDQLQLDLKHLVADIEDVKARTDVVSMDQLRADHEDMSNIASQMSEFRHEVIELRTLSNAVVHASQRQDDVMKLLADLTEREQLMQNDQSNQFLQLHERELAFTQDILSCLAVSKSLSEMHELSGELEEVILQGVETVVQKVRSDFEVIKVEIQNFRKAAHDQVRVWNLSKIATEQENQRLVAAVEELQLRNSVLNVEVDDRRRSIDILAEELVVKEQRMAHSLQLMRNQLKAVENERDKFQTDLVVLNEQLDMAQTLADERDLLAVEARTAAELSKSVAQQKEEEARILERSVDELERTVYALETQLGIVKRESEKQRVAREVLEKELETVKHQMGLMQVTIDSQAVQTGKDSQDAETSKAELDRIIIEMKNQQIQARKSVESLQQECAEKDVQLRSCKAHIAELMLGAEKQASENQQKLKTLESMVEHLKVEERKVNPACGSASKVVDKCTGKVKGAGSPFKCIGSGLEKQRTSEVDEELSSAKKRIKELEAVAASRQKEVFMLNTKLAEAESMTHDVVRDLLGVKMDIASYATLLNQQQVQRIAERARRRTVDAQEKEEELGTLRERLNEFIEERESWLEEINRRQAEAVAARVSAEKLRLRDQTLTAENDGFREDCQALRKKVTDLEDEIKKLSGQQNLQQRIHHHAKIKEENNTMRLQNEDLSGKLRRMEILFARVNDELARYRTAEGKSAFLNFDEEARLQKKLQETEENRLELAETLIGLCTGIMQAAGIQTASRDLDPSAAMLALQKLQDRLDSLEREVSDCKLQARIAVEKQRLSDLREFHTPVKTICTNTNFTASQQLPSPVSSSR